MSIKTGDHVSEDAEESRLVALQDSGLLDATDDAAPFDVITRLAQRVLQVDTVRLTLVDRDKQVFKSQVGLHGPAAEEGSTTLDRSFCKYAVATGERLVIDDARESPLLRRSPAIAQDDVVAYAGEPLTTRGGHVLGTLCVTEGSPREWTEEDLAVLNDLTQLAVAEIEYRMQARDLGQVQTLALRLPEPVEKLGDAVRSTSSLAESPDDPRLLRMADVARARVQTVEALSHDLAQAAAETMPEQPRASRVDLRSRVMGAARLALSAADEADLDLDIGSERVFVDWVGSDLDRGLALTLTTALHHLGEGHAVRVSLVADEVEAVLTVHSPGHRLPVGDLLRVASAFAAEDAAAASVSTRNGTTTVRNGCLNAHTHAGGSEFSLSLPIVDTASTSRRDGSTDGMG